MIKGIGVDIIEIDRIKVSIETYGKSFIDKFLLQTKLNIAQRKQIHFNILPPGLPQKRL